MMTRSILSLVMMVVIEALACFAYQVPPDHAAATTVASASSHGPAAAAAAASSDGPSVVVHKEKPRGVLYSFYWHDMVGTKNATAIPVISNGAAGSDNNATSSTSNNNNNNNGIVDFGTVFVFDDPLTVGPSLNSPLFGRAQGMFVANSLSGDNVMVLCTIIINDPFHRGTINLQGADGYRLPEREIPVVGGTEDFRYKRGYAQFKTFATSSANCSVLYVRLHLYHQGPN